MDPSKIAKENHAFFFIAVGMAMCKSNFVSAVLDSFYEPALYGIENSMNSGYVRIDSTNIISKFQAGFIDAVRAGILGKVARDVPYSVRGELNTEAEVIHGIYKFSFRVSQYERDGEHNFEIVDDQTLLPDDERIGRLDEEIEEFVSSAIKES